VNFKISFLFFKKSCPWLKKIFTFFIMPQKFEAPSEHENQVYILRMAEIQRFEATIEKIRNILRSVAITGMDSMRHCCLYILSRAITRETAVKLQIPDKFAWENMMHTLHTVDGGDQKVIDLFGNPHQESLVAHFDRLFKTQNFSFDVKSLSKHKEILGILNPLNFNTLDSSMDILGWVYEDHLRKGSSSSRDLGQFFTDRKICDYMVALCKPTFKMPGVPESICDPTMGTAGFLSMFIKYFKETYPDTPVDWNIQQKEIHGCDSDSKVAGLARLNLFLESGGVFQNLITKDSLNTDLPAMGYDIICANMPFGLKGLKYADSCERVKNLAINTTKSEPLFLQLMMVSLNQGGRCAVVVPDGMLVNNSKGHNATRKYLLDNFELKRVIKMRGSFFTNTGIQPSIMYFVNTGKPTCEVEFWDVEDKGNGTVIEKMMLSVPRSKFDDACSLDMRRYQEVAVVANTGGYPMVKMGDIVEFKNGKNIPERDRFESGTYPYYASNGISGFVEKSIFEGPSVLLGDQGSAWYRSHHFVENGVKFYAGNHTIIMASKYETLNIKYLYYFLLLKDLTDFNKCAALIPELDKERFYLSNMPLPPLPIQQEIITALDLIYNNAATAKAAATSVKSQMAAVVRSVGARGFERKKLGDLYDCPKTIKRFNSGDRDSTGNVPFFNGKWSCPDGTHTDYSFDLNSPYLVMIKDGGGDHNSDTVGMGKFFRVRGKCAITSHNMVLTPKAANGIEYDFLYHYLTMNAKSIRDMATYSINLGGISKESIVNYEIPVPPLPIQHEVLAILNEMEAELATLEQMATKAEQRAKFILDGYLTPAPTIEAEPVTDPNSISAFIEKHIVHEEGAETIFKKVAFKYKEWATSRPEHVLVTVPELKIALSLVLGELENEKYKGIKLI
jgi:restriction endonuclease S subunit